MERPIFSLDKITAIIRGRMILPETTWNVYPNQNWAVIGPNGSGKSLLCRVLLGQVPVCCGLMQRDPALYAQNGIAYVSFNIQQQLMLREDREDLARAYKGTVDEVTTMREIIMAVKADELDHRGLERIIARLHLQSLLDRGVRSLSHGEIRKMMIARGMVKNPKLLILDEPFDGLDASSRTMFSETINLLMEHDLKILLITHRLEEIPENVTHVLCLKDCKIFAQGKKEDILNTQSLKRLYQGENLNHTFVPDFNKSRQMLEQVPDEVLISMENVRVQYGAVTVLNGFNWTMKKGEHWAIAGPNGAGKSTLLSLISAENLQAYSNKIYLFGRRRGTGESIWDIKKKIGKVSAELQVRYYSHLSTMQVILSGFFDSMGLYQQYSPEQRLIALQWIRIFSLEEKADSPFNQLSQGQQRMALLARAMVKSPLLLILDEPCQGLDYANRKKILDLVDYIAKNTEVHILYVTHHLDESLACINRILQFERSPQGFFRTHIKLV